MCDGLIVNINPLTRTYEVYFKKAKKTDYVSTYYIKNHLHVGELDKFPVGTKITKKFKSVEYYGEVTTIDHEERMFRVKYTDGDGEDMSPLDIRRFADKDDNNSKKRKKGRENNSK